MLTLWLNVVLLGLSALLLGWTGLLALQAVASLVVKAAVPTLPAADSPRTVVLMPAHNEASIVPGTLRNVLPQLGPSDSLLLVADNCSDDTAVVARAAGARVVERTSATARGKGHALAFGLQQLADAPPDVVLVLDADCTLRPGSLPLLVRQAMVHQRPVQALYLMRAPVGSGFKTRMAAFAWAFRNETRALGYQRLGLPCQLMGSGMALPWSVLDRVSFATGHIVEDLKMGLDYAAAGGAPLLCADALVESDFPLSDEGTQSQRKRWEHGHLSMVVSDAPRRVWQALVQRNAALLALALDMSVPPLALLALLLMGHVWLTLLAVWWLHATVWALAVALAAAALFGLAVLIGWWCVGRRWLGAWELVLAPLYIVRKVPLYVGFLWRRQVEWVKTKR